MRVVGQMLINLEMSFIRGFLQFLLLYPPGSNLCKHADSGSWRVHLINRVWRSGSSLEFSALFDICLQQWVRQIVNVKHSILSGKFAFLNLGFHAFVIFIQRSVTCPCVDYIGSQYDASAKVSTVNTHTIIDINIIIQSYQVHYSVLNWYLFSTGLCSSPMLNKGHIVVNPCDYSDWYSSGGTFYFRESITCFVG